MAYFQITYLVFKSHVAISIEKMLGNWKNALKKGESASALLMDFSKAFDTINHNLLLAKIKAYVLSEDALTLIWSYLKNREQRVLINNRASTTKTVAVGV